MKKAIFYLTILLPFCSSGALGQDATERSRQSDEVKKVVEQIARSGKVDAEIVLRDLRELEGKISSVYQDSFEMKFKEPKKPLFTVGNTPQRKRRPPMLIKYRDVLQIAGKKIVLSFVPDPKKTPHSSWEEISTIGVGEVLQVHTNDGRKSHGVFLKGSSDRLPLIRGNTETQISKDQIVRIYRVIGDTSTIAAKIFGGGKRGAEVADIMLPIMDALARSNPVGLAIGAAIGAGSVAVMHVLPKGGIKRVLVFAQ